MQYCHVISSTSTEKISTDLHKLQNSILRIIKYFPIKKTITHMHKTLNIEPLEFRLNKLFQNYTTKKTNQGGIIIEEVKKYLETNPQIMRINNRFKTPFEKWSELQQLERI